MVGGREIAGGPSNQTQLVESNSHQASDCRISPTKLHLPEFTAEFEDFMNLGSSYDEKVLDINEGCDASIERDITVDEVLEPRLGRIDGKLRKVEEGKVQSSQPLTLGERLGLEDFFSLKVWQASLAELLGTGVLVFMIDTIVISANETNTSAPKLVMAVLISLTVALLVLATIPVSGGHINPIVSMTAGLLGRISLSRAAIYILAQSTGAVLGALALKAVVNSTIESTFSLGGCTVTVVGPGLDGPMVTGLEMGQAFFLEVICSFVFLFASRWIAFDPRQAKVVGRVVVCLSIGLAAGLNVFVSTTVTGVRGYSGAGMNPARCVGPAIVRGGHLWNGHWIFWAGPGLASMVFYLYTRFIPDDHFSAEEEKHDFFNILKSLLVSDGDHKK